MLLNAKIPQKLSPLWVKFDYLTFWKTTTFESSTGDLVPRGLTFIKLHQKFDNMLEKGVKEGEMKKRGKIRKNILHFMQICWKMKKKGKNWKKLLGF